MTLDSNGREEFLILMLQSMALGDRVRIDLHRLEPEDLAQAIRRLNRAAAGLVELADDFDRPELVG